MRSVGALLEELEALGIEVRADGDVLEYEGPEAAVTPRLLDKLKQHKGELMDLLTGAHRPAGATRPGPATRRLEAYGWESKERRAKTIWQDPKNGFWYSEEMALGLSEKGGET